MIEKPNHPFKHQKHHYFNGSMHCYESPQLRGLAQHCKTHHVKQQFTLGNQKENGETNIMQKYAVFNTCIDVIVKPVLHISI